MLIIIATGLLALVLGAARWFISGNMRMLVMIARYGLMAMAGLALILLLFSGRLSPFFIGVLACLPLLGSFHKLWQETKETFHDTNLQPSTFDRATALSILGVSEEASVEDIKASHKKLIQKLHPDKGGSAYLAQEVNHARDILIKEDYNEN